MAEQNSGGHTAVSRVAVLVIGDLLVILSFVIIGRQSHALALADVGADLFTALPFVVGWFVVAPWLGLYGATESVTPVKLLPRLLLTWLIAVPLGQILRALLLQRPIPGGIPVTFVLVSLAYLGLVMLAWRLGYLWWANRRTQSIQS